MCSRSLKHLGLESDAQTNLRLFFKYGMDGTNIDEYRQKVDTTPELRGDKIFASSFVPLKLVNSDTN